MIGGYDDGNDAWSSRDGLNWHLRTTHASFSPRAYHQVVLFNNKLWLYGGIEITGGNLNDIWSSSDGVNWNREAINASFSAEESNEIVVYKDKLWRIGGTGSFGLPSNEIWTSQDGVTRVNTPVASVFPAKSGASVIVFKDELLIIEDNGVVWFSTEGTQWIQKSSERIAPPRIEHRVTVLNGKLWLIGGNQRYSTFQEVWSSDDCISLTLIHEHAPNSTQDFNLTTYQNKLWLIAGLNNVGGDWISNNRIFSSENGIAWTQESTDGQFSARSKHKVTTFNEQMWLVGGFAYQNDEIWSSVDGINWLPQIPNISFGGRTGRQILSFSNRLWLIGGWSNLATQSLNDVWSTVDGRSWIVEKEHTEFSARHDHAIAVFKNRMWLFGGEKDSVFTGSGFSSRIMSDIWSSEDGVDWVKQAEDAIFGQRKNSHLITYKDQLWLVGGIDETGIVKKDIWSSSDGVTWTLRSENIPSSTSVGVHEGKIWLVGDAVWSSIDGIDWVLQKDIPPFNFRKDFALVDFNHQMFLIGGDDFLPQGIDQAASGGLKNDIWSSMDGIEWRKGFRSYFQLID